MEETFGKAIIQLQLEILTIYNTSAMILYIQSKQWLSGTKIITTPFPISLVINKVLRIWKLTPIQFLQHRAMAPYFSCWWKEHVTSQ